MFCRESTPHPGVIVWELTTLAWQEHQGQSPPTHVLSHTIRMASLLTTPHSSDTASQAAVGGGRGVIAKSWVVAGAASLLRECRITRAGKEP